MTLGTHRAAQGQGSTISRTLQYPSVKEMAKTDARFAKMLQDPNDGRAPASENAQVFGL